MMRNQHSLGAMRHNLAFIDPQRRACQETMRHYWGSELDALSDRAMYQLRQTGFLMRFGWACQEWWRVSGASLMSLDLAVINFDGVKYFPGSLHGGMRAVLWHDVPRCCDDKVLRPWLPRLEGDEGWCPALVVTLSPEATLGHLAQGTASDPCWILDIYTLCASVPVAWVVIPARDQVTMPPTEAGTIDL